MRNNKGLPEGDPRHGTPNGYINHRCRCAECRAANNETVKKQRLTRKYRLVADPSLAPHGTVNTYHNWSCRCRACKDAHTAYYREHREAKKQSDDN